MLYVYNQVYPVCRLERGGKSGQRRALHRGNHGTRKGTESVTETKPPNLLGKGENVR